MGLQSHFRFSFFSFNDKEIYGKGSEKEIGFWEGSPVP
jgi:hypothetical protein